VKVGVLGAGLAGLAAGCELADLGHEVTLIERRPWAGGKTYSFVDESTGESVDNGQHVFLGCTTEYTAFLRRLGTLPLTKRQRRLCVQVFDGEGRRCTIASDAFPAPFHLVRSLVGYGHLSLRERIGVARLVASVTRMSEATREALSNDNFASWLRGHGQSDRVIARFWDFLVLPTLNCRSAETSTRDALFVLQEGFLASSTSSAVGVPTVGLSQLHVDPAVAYVEARGGSLRTGVRVREIGCESGAVRRVVTDHGAIEMDAWVCALAPWDVADLLPPDVLREAPFALLKGFRPGPIINLHFWFAEPVAMFPFAAFLDGDLQWVFNRSRLDRTHSSLGQHLVVSLSSATPYMALDKSALEALLLPQLRRALGVGENVTPTKVVAIKEPAATFIPAPGLERPGTDTPLANLVLAGAHCDTGWPATMESAVRSGLAAARSLHARRTTLQAAASAVATQER
jgi:hydroxysqualene dehydroxylase